MNFKNYLLVFLLAQLSFSSANAQKIKVVQDFRTIQEAEVVKSVAKKWEFNLGTRVVLEKNSSRPGEFDVDAGINYKIIKFISVGIEYWWSENRNKSDEFKTKNRLGAEVEFKSKIRRLKAEYRICFQNIDDDYFQNNEGAISKNILRNRIQLKYNIRKCPFSPYLFAEHYGQLETNNKFGIKFKGVIGSIYSINSNHELKGYFRIDRELNNVDPFTYFSLGIDYSHYF